MDVNDKICKCVISEVEFHYLHLSESTIRTLRWSPQQQDNMFTVYVGVDSVIQVVVTIRQLDLFKLV